jgi:hypothetical protein
VPAIKKRFNAATLMWGSPAYQAGTGDCHPYMNNCSWYRVDIGKDGWREDTVDVYCRYNDKGEVLSIQIRR